jgi:hypothetical protein
MNTDKGINMKLRFHLMETLAETAQRRNGSMSANRIDLESLKVNRKQENQPKSVIIVYQHKQSDSSNNNGIINFSSPR